MSLYKVVLKVVRKNKDGADRSAAETVWVTSSTAEKALKAALADRLCASVQSLELVATKVVNAGGAW